MKKLGLALGSEKHAEMMRLQQQKVKLWRKDLQDHGVQREDIDYLEARYFSSGALSADIVDKLRTYQLVLTDGVNTIKALEYESCPQLDLAKAGDFFLLRPPFDMQNEMLFLQPENLDVIFCKKIQSVLEKKEKELQKLKIINQLPKSQTKGDGGAAELSYLGVPPRTSRRKYSKALAMPKAPS